MRLGAPFELFCHTLLIENIRVHAFIRRKPGCDCLLRRIEKPKRIECIHADRLAVFRHGERRLLCVLQHRLILLKNRPLHLLRVLRCAVQPVIRKTRARAKHQQHTKRNDPSLFHSLFLRLFRPPASPAAISHSIPYRARDAIPTFDFFRLFFDLPLGKRIALHRAEDFRLEVGILRL